MDKYPTYFLTDAKPLVFLQGIVENEPDFDKRLLRSLDVTSIEMTDPKESINIDFRTIPMDHEYLMKKAPKEHINLDGLLRENWIYKHHDLLPSLVVMLCTFCVDWSSSEWIRREASLYERYTRLKNVLAARDVKLVVIPVRTGTSTALDKDSIDERIGSLKRHLQIDSKLFMMITLQEIAAGSTTMRRLVKNIREISNAYYTAQGKRAKALEKGSSIKGPLENIVNARYTWKVGYFNEFLGQRAQSLKYYKISFQSLCNATEAGENSLMDQIKTLADYCNYKICSIYLKSGAVREATLQFKTFISYFVSIYSESIWRHYSWLSDQYIIYAQLLNQYSFQDPMVETDISYFYQNAARFASKRQISFARVRNGVRNEALVAKYSNALKLAPRYLGSSPLLVDPTSGHPTVAQIDELYQLMKLKIEDEERQVDHGAVVRGLLSKSMDTLDVSQLRRRAFIRSLLAEQYVIEGKFDEALKAFSSIIDFLCKENWVECAVSVLRKMLFCALALGASTSYLRTAITLFSLDFASQLSVYEKDELHRDIMSIMTSTAISAETAIGAFYSKSDFGVAHNVANIEYSLPQDFCVDLADATYSKMFDVKVNFEAPSVEVGHAVRVNMVVSSNFHGLLTFSEMNVCFTSDCLVRKFIHDGSGSGDCEGGLFESEEDLIAANSHLFRASADQARRDRRPSISTLVSSTYLSPTKAPLVFPARKSIKFSFLLFVPENCFSSGNVSLDPCIFVEKLVFTMSVPIAPADREGENEFKRIILNANALSRSFVTKRESFGKGMLLKDMVLFLPPSECPALLQINKLGGFVEMIFPKPLPAPIVAPTALSLNTPLSAAPASVAAMIAPTINLLQGPVQRIDIVFNSNINSVLNGKLYLSSDLSSISNGSQQHLFWFPDTTDLNEGDVDDETKLDTIKFHPFKLNASMQPSQPISIPNQSEPNSVFSIPLFVKSEIHTTVTVKLLMEYIPKKRLTTTITKEFEVKLCFGKPLQMNFTMSSWKENHCGVPRDANMPTVLTGDIMNMTASLTCISSLNSTIDVLSMFLQQPATAIGEKRDFKYLDSKSNKRFNFIPSEYSNETDPSESSSINLSVNEVFLANVDIECIQPEDGVIKSLRDTVRMGHHVVETYAQSNSNSAAGAASTTSNRMSQPGDMFVAWRYVDKQFMKPLSLVPFGSSFKGETTVGDGNSSVKQSLEDRLLPISSDSTDSAASVDDIVTEDAESMTAPFSWLYKPLPMAKRSEPSRAKSDDRGAASISPLDMSLDASIISSRVCEMMFSVPTVSIVDAPFEVTLDTPASCSVGEFQSMAIKIRSKVWSIERLVVQLYLHENLLITGSTACTLEVGPRMETTISFGFAALKCGQVNLPQVSVIWERSGIPIVDLGVGRHVFVYP